MCSARGWLCGRRCWASGAESLTSAQPLPREESARPKSASRPGPIAYLEAVADEGGYQGLTWRERRRLVAPSTSWRWLATHRRRVRVRGITLLAAILVGFVVVWWSRGVAVPGLGWAFMAICASSVTWNGWTIPREVDRYDAQSVPPAPGESLPDSVDQS